MNRKFACFSIASVAVLLAASAAMVFAQEMPKPRTNPGFEQLKSLAGDWEGLNAEGKPVHVEYQIASNGTALMERLHPMGDVEMVTMYSSDGDRLAVTHYCNTGNQPQMQTAPVTAATQQFSFDFVRATNLDSPAAGHMGKLVVTLQDHAHFTQQWSWVENSKVAHTEVFHFTRKS